MDDKIEELRRYEGRARRRLDSVDAPEPMPLGAASSAPVYRAPYLFYTQCIRDEVLPSHHVLELGAGAGTHTQALLRTGARVTATDISPSSLTLLQQNLAAEANGRLDTRVADMEALPFERDTFDVVTSAGSLSYGDAEVVDSEIRRVLRPGGTFMAVDSLDHNPIYRLNRWLQVVQGKRTRSTYLRMPGAARIDAIRQHFASVEVQYFGALTWAMPMVARIVGDDRAAALSDVLDRLLRVERSAFKFVLVARGRR